MNTSSFTTNQLRNIVIELVRNEHGITENICHYDKRLCEIPKHYCENSDPAWEIEITFAEEDKGLLNVEWSLHFNESYEDAGDAWTFKYQTIVEIPIVKLYTEKLY